MLLVCVHFLGKKLSYDLNSYYWRVVMTNKDNMMITIMIVKAVIKKNIPAKCSCELFEGCSLQSSQNVTGEMGNLHRYMLY